MKVRKKKPPDEFEEKLDDIRQRLWGQPPPRGVWRALIRDRRPRIEGMTVDVIKGIGDERKSRRLFDGHIYTEGCKYFERIMERMKLEVARRTHRPGDEYVGREELVTPRMRRKAERLARREKENRLKQLRLFRLKKSNAHIVQEMQRRREERILKEAPLKKSRKRKVSSRGSRL